MDNKITWTVIVSILALIAAGCGAAPVPMAEPMEATVVVEKEVEREESAAAPAEPGSRAADQASTERLIIRNASLDVVVPDTQEAVGEIRDMVNGLGGYVVESSVNKYQESLRARLTLRVPAESLDSALDRIRNLATEVRRENISGQDVTEEYVDLKSRMRHLEATEEQLLKFLKEAEDTEAALAVYDRLENIQADIEQVKGRMQYLEESAAMATITIDITPDELTQPIEVGGWQPRGTLRNAVERLIRVLQFLVDAAIVIVIDVIPVLVIIAVPFVGIFFLVRAIIRRRRVGKAKED